MTVGPLVALITTGAVAARLVTALRAAGYRARSVPRRTAADPPALDAWLAAQRPVALVVDARALRPSQAPHVYDAAAAGGVELVVASIYAGGDAEDVRGASAPPVGRRVAAADVVRGVRRAIGPVADARV